MLTENALYARTSAQNLAKAWTVRRVRAVAEGLVRSRPGVVTPLCERWRRCMQLLDTPGQRSERENGSYSALLRLIARGCQYMVHYQGLKLAMFGQI